MPRILRIINRFNLGGPTFNAAYLTRYLSPAYETMLVGGLKEDHEDTSEFIVEQLGIEPVVIPEMRRSIDWKNDKIAYQKITKIIQEFKPDIVHTHASKAGAIGRRAAAKQKVPAIVHTFHGHVFHSYFGKAKTAAYKVIERRLAKKSHAIVAISDIQKQELTEQHRVCDPQKTHVIPNGFDLDRFYENRPEKRITFREKWGIAQDDLVIAIVGRLVPIKNHELFLRAFKKVVDQTDLPVRALIVGDGEARAELETLCNALQLTHQGNRPSVIFTSWIKEVDEVNAAADIAALSSLNEGTPVSLIEAQASALPIVTTEVGGIADIVQRDRSAFLCDSGDVDTFASHLLQLVQNPELREKMGAIGAPFVKEQFHYRRLVRDMDALYQQLLSK